MIHVHSLEEIKANIEENKVTLLYISRLSCSVCHSLLPQVEELLTQFPAIVPIHANADQIPEIAGEYSVFTVPAVLVFANGKEMIREARFVPIGELEEQLSKLISHLTLT
ncbi:thioredoxin family protein [Siminovitchia sp. FSL W7-1587]|uniref:thioredoxin family protein n=1 Tax=Siminovitchia sp. FSL W7-1587 TaxID=2954699 RepID=UPI0030CDD5F5